MPIVEIAFYLFGGVLIGSALSVVTVGNPIYAVLFLVLSFFSAACIWMLLQAEFLAIVLVLVYVGAVMVLFLFVVMMLDVNVNPVKEGFARYLPIGLLVALGMAAQMFMVIWTQGMETQVLPSGKPRGYSHTRPLGSARQDLPVCLRGCCRDLARRDYCGYRADPSSPAGDQVSGSEPAGSDQAF